MERLINENDMSPLELIKNCVHQRRILWTYHIALRMKERHIGRYEILAAVDSFEIIEKYPHDKFLPSCLVWANYEGRILHVLIAVSFDEDYLTFITTYEPSIDEWTDNFKKRRQI